MTDEEYDDAYVKYLNRTDIDGWDIRRVINRMQVSEILSLVLLSFVFTVEGRSQSTSYIGNTKIDFHENSYPVNFGLERGEILLFRNEILIYIFLPRP